MLFKPDLNETAKAAGDRVARVASGARRRTVSITIVLLILDNKNALTHANPSGGRR
jgi:multidrug efflux system membrane fusion protein